MSRKPIVNMKVLSRNDTEGDAIVNANRKRAEGKWCCEPARSGMTETTKKWRWNSIPILFQIRLYEIGMSLRAKFESRA